MESDYKGFTLKEHQKIARWVGDELHRRYHCQTQIVWSGNKSNHIHFRINRRNMLPSEVVAIQKYLTAEMQQLVRTKFKLPNFAFDQRVAGRLELVRLGNGTRLQIGHVRADDPQKYDGVRVNRPQPIIRYWDMDFDDPDTIFPITPDIKRALRTYAIHKARYRAKAKSSSSPRPSDQQLADYADFLRDIGITVMPSHWGRKADGTQVIICYYGPKDPNPSCPLGLADQFVTDSRGTKHSVGVSYAAWQEATAQNPPCRTGQHPDGRSWNRTHRRGETPGVRQPFQGTSSAW